MRNAHIKLIRPGTLAAAAALAAAALLSGCGQSRAPESRPIAQAPTRAAPAPASNRTVDADGTARVALLAPLTAADGRARSEAEGIADAARLAARDLGDARLALEVYDTGGTVAGTSAAARKAVADGAALVLGPVFAENARAAGAVAAQAGVNVISFSTTAGVAGGNVWLIGLLPSNEADRIVGYAARNGHGAIGVFYPNTAYGAAARDAVSKAAARAGASVVASGAYDRSFEGIQEGGKIYAQEHLASGATAVVLPEEGQGLRTAAAFLDYYGVSPRSGKYLGLGGWNNPVTTKEPALRGGWFPAPDPARLEQFAQRFQAAYGRAPSALASLGYDAVAAAGTLLREARGSGSTTPFSAQAITDPGGFIGVNGVFRFTPDGLNERGLAVLEVGADGFSVIDPAPDGFGGPGA